MQSNVTTMEVCMCVWRLNGAMVCVCNMHTMPDWIIIHLNRVKSEFSIRVIEWLRVCVRRKKKRKFERQFYCMLCYLFTSNDAYTHTHFCTCAIFFSLCSSCVKEKENNKENTSYTDFFVRVVKSLLLDLCVWTQECVLSGTYLCLNSIMSATDSNKSEIFSLRIVSIDNYMRAPVLGLDSCYSEFRAEAVKQVRFILLRFFCCCCCLDNWILGFLFDEKKIGFRDSCVRYRFEWYQNVCPHSWCISISLRSICRRWFGKWNWSLVISIGDEFGQSNQYFVGPIAFNDTACLQNCSCQSQVSSVILQSFECVFLNFLFLLLRPQTILWISQKRTSIFENFPIQSGIHSACSEFTAKWCDTR